MISSRLSALVHVPCLAALIASFALVVGCTSTVTTEKTEPGENELTADAGADAKQPKPIVDPDASRPAAEIDVCAQLCERAVACDPATDADTCKSQCNNTNASFVSKLRDEYKQELASCIDKAACKDLDSGTAISRCVDESTAKVSVTTEASSFCDEYAATATKCGEKLDKANCFERAKIYSSATLTEADKCFDKMCSAVDTCVKAATASSTSWTTAAAPVCSAKMPYSDTTCSSCMSGSCCSQDNACANSTSCKSYISCVVNCTTTTCQSNCGYTYPTGKTLAQSLISCMSSSCPSSCGD